MKVQHGLIARFNNAPPSFYDPELFDFVQLVGRSLEGNGPRTVESFEIGKRMVNCSTGQPAYDRKVERSHVGFIANNATTDLQFSQLVRAHTDCKCNGFTFLPGHLRASDFKRLGIYGSTFEE